MDFDEAEEFFEDYVEDGDYKNIKKLLIETGFYSLLNKSNMMNVFFGLEWFIPVHGYDYSELKKDFNKELKKSEENFIDLLPLYVIGNKKDVSLKQLKELLKQEMYDLNIKLEKSIINASLNDPRIDTPELTEYYNYISKKIDDSSKKMQKNLSKKYVSKISSYVKSKEGLRQISGLRKLSKELPEDVEKKIRKLIAFGKKRKTKNALKKKVLPKILKNKAKKLGIRLTITRNGNRVYKSKAVLEKQIKNKLKQI